MHSWTISFWQYGRSPLMTFWHAGEEMRIRHRGQNVTFGFGENVQKPGVVKHERKYIHQFLAVRAMFRRFCQDAKSTSVKEFHALFTSSFSQMPPCHPDLFSFSCPFTVFFPIFFPLSPTCGATVSRSLYFLLVSFSHSFNFLSCQMPDISCCWVSPKLRSIQMFYGGNKIKQYNGLLERENHSSTCYLICVNQLSRWQTADLFSKWGQEGLWAISILFTEGLTIFGHLVSIIKENTSASKTLRPVDCSYKGVFFFSTVNKIMDLSQNSILAFHSGFKIEQCLCAWAITALSWS